MPRSKQTPEERKASNRLHDIAYRARRKEEQAFKERRAEIQRKYWASLDEEQKKKLRANRVATEQKRTMAKLRQQQRDDRKRGKTGRRPSKVTGDQLFNTVMKALDGKYDMDTRMDIASETLLAFMSGEVSTIKEAVALGMKRHWKMFSKFTTRSLDAEIADGLRLIDLIDSEHERL